MTQFKTGKQLPLFEVYEVKDGKTEQTISTIATSSSIQDAKRSEYCNSSIDFSSIDDTTFIDYNNLVQFDAISVALDIRGTSIKFNTMKIFDKDSTITKVEIEDDRMNRYPVSLAPVDSNNVEKGAYPQVTGLQRATPYIFRKLYITANPENESITKYFNFVTLSGFSQASQNITAVAHNICN